MRTIQRAAGMLLTAAAAILLSGCGDSIGSATGTLTVQLTDAPFPFDAVDRADIFVVRIDGKIAESSEAQAQNDPAPAGNVNPGAGWVTLAAPNASYNLLDLQRGATTNLGQVTLPTGTYRGFRLILDTDQSSITLKDGTVLTGTSLPAVQWPSAGETGIKIQLDQPIELVENGTVMVIDFDLGRSFVLRGATIQQNGLLFTPVIRGAARDLTGSISGTVRAGDAGGPLVEGAAVEVLTLGTPIGDTDPANVVGSGSTDAQGVFKIAFLQPGSYAVRATPPSTLAQHDPVLLPSVTVTSGSDTGGNLLVLPHQ